MSMTRKEAIDIIENKIQIDVRFCTKEEVEQYQEALTMAISALRPVSREQVEKVWRGCEYCGEEWGTCNPITNRFTMPPRGGIRLCPMCGKPLTDEAVEMVMERMETIHDNRT